MIWNLDFEDLLSDMLIGSGLDFIILDIVGVGVVFVFLLWLLSWVFMIGGFLGILLMVLFFFLVG